MSAEKDRPDSSVVGRMPPPRKGDTLFGSDADWEMNACVNYGYGPQLYGDGYLVAARSLAKQVIESRQEQDVLIYPIVYLYRHHCELTLKSILGLASRLLDKPLEKAQEAALGGHGLLHLWTQVRPLLNPVCAEAAHPDFPPEDLDGVESCIQQLHAYDPDAQRFRYATFGRKGQPKQSLPESLTIINIRVFTEAMERVADYLRGIDDWFDYLLDAKYEMERDYANGY
jgi:hypothetical protein